MLITSKECKNFYQAIFLKKWLSVREHKLELVKTKEFEANIFFVNDDNFSRKTIINFLMNHTLADENVYVENIKDYCSGLFFLAEELLILLRNFI